jgi:hypothetical protein
MTFSESSSTSGLARQKRELAETLTSVGGVESLGLVPDLEGPAHDEMKRTTLLTHLEEHRTSVHDASVHAGCDVAELFRLDLGEQWDLGDLILLSVQLLGLPVDLVRFWLVLQKSVRVDLGNVGEQIVGIGIELDYFEPRGNGGEQLALSGKKFLQLVELGDGLIPSSRCHEPISERDSRRSRPRILLDEGAKLGNSLLGLT